MSRLRGSLSVKDGTRISSSARDRPRDEQRDDSAHRSYKNGTNRYHFGMTGQRDDEASKNGRDHGDDANEDPDLLYEKSKEHFGSWDIKEIVRNDGFGTRKQTDRFDDSRAINGRSKNESIARHDRYDDREDSRNDRGRAESVDREHAGSHRSRKREGREGADNGKASSKFGRSKNEGKGDSSRIDERDQLLREIESLAVDGRSPDRRIRAMIERFKAREEDKLKCRKEHDSLSPNREECKSKSAGRSDVRVDDGNDRDRGRLQKDDREDERRASRSKPKELDKFEQDEPGRSRSMVKRADKYNDSFADKKNESYSLDKDRRRSREIEDDVPRRKDSPRRRSYVYEGNPDDFDVRIQRYERGLPEPRRDVDSPRRVSLKDSAPDAGRKDSFKEHDRQVSRKSSFKSGESKNSHSRDRESGLSGKTSFKEQENGVYGRNSSKGRDMEKKYFGRDPEHVSRKCSFKDQGYDEAGRKNSFKEQSSDYGRISLKNREDDEEKMRRDGVSRITFKENDSPAESARSRFCRDQESDTARVSVREPSGETCRKNSFKEKTVEFAGIFYKEHSDDRDRRTVHKVQDNASNKVSFQGHDDRDEPEANPANDEEHDFERKSSSRERDSSKRRTSSSLRRTYEAADKRSGRHRKPLSPSMTDDPDCAEDRDDRDAYDSKSWQETNRIFAVKYLRENGRHRTNPEGRSEIERDPSPETRFPEHRNRKPLSEEIEEGARRNSSNADTYGLDAGDRSRDSAGRYASTHERNGATIIRIRSSPETVSERRRRRRPAQEAHAGRRRRYEAEDGEESDEDEEEEEDDDDDDGGNRRQRTVAARGNDFVQERGVPTPSRRVWNYREGGVVITDIEEGQPCLRCYDKCTGFSPHEWRKNCTNCRCPREAHDVCHEEWASVRSRLGLKGEEFTSSVSCDPKTLGFAWVPPGLPAHKVEKYFSMLPKISVPRRGTAGVRYRDRELAFQLPKQDLARAYCRHLNPEHASSADDFMAARNEIALDIGSVQEVLERDLDCGACREPLEYGDLAVSASKLGLLYHPNCFRCTSCRELLVDLAYCVHDDTLFCERHYAEQLKPRCAACDELIFSGEYTKAMNKDWHSGHFCCWQCDEPLTGQRYVLKDVNHPYCIKCYESAFANSCEECNKIIGIDSKDLSYKDKHWHEACFLCNSCRVSLVDKQFGSKVDKIYCGNCYDSQFANRCDGCGEIFRAGTKKMEYKLRQWHEKCFCCVVCKNPIGTKSFIPREQEIYCAGCYEDKFATRCVKCNKVITTGGVTYKNEPWHRDCFTCSNCNTSLAGQRFTSRDDKPYCADCFGELFAKRCTACSKPITGIGGTRFISFEDRHWHNDCFICAGCKTSLVGRGFITDGEDVICPECAKTKLM